MAEASSPPDAVLLVAYLERYLPTGLPYDQGCVPGSLLHLDARLGTDHAARLLDPAGPRWQPWFDAADPSGCGDRIAKVSALAEKATPAARSGP